MATNTKPGKSNKYPGTCYQREDGNRLWVAQILINGKRRSASFGSRKEAINWLWEQDEQKKLGNQLTLSAFLRDWIQRKNPLFEADGNTQVKRDQDIDKINGVKPWKETTFGTNRAILYNHILPYLNDNILLADVTREWVVGFFADAMGRHVGGRTLEIMRNILRQAYNEAIKREMVTKNPVVDISCGYECAERPILTREQFTRLTTVAASTWYKNIIPFTVSAKLRRGEVLGLTWDMISWETGEIYITQQLQRLPQKGKKKIKGKNIDTDFGTALVLRNVKTRSSDRVIPVGKTTMDYLRDQKRMVEIQRQIMGDAWNENNMVFPSQIGKPMELHTLRRAFKGLLKKASIDESFRFHDLRHTGISFAQTMQVGATKKQAGAFAGHADEKTTNRYSHNVDEDLRRIADRMDDFLFGGDEE